MEPVQNSALEANKSKSKKSGANSQNVTTIFVLFFTLLLTATFFLGTGYLFGKFLSLPETTKKINNSQSNKTKSDLVLYEDKENGFRLNHPKNWTATKKMTAIPEVIVSKEKNSIEIWFSVEKPLSFNAEHKEALVTTNSLDLKIGEQTAKMTEYIYTAGNYFSIVRLAASQNTSLVTFWIQAEDQENYSTAKEIVQTFAFN